MADYKNAHLAWLKSCRDFEPKYPSDYKSGTYLDVMTTLYADERIPMIMAYHMFISDKAWYKKSKKIAREIDKQVEKLEPTPPTLWFVTLNFNHQTWNVKDCTKCIEKILAMDWIIRAKANFEYYRENGEHPHCHFLLETKEPKSRILDKIFRPLYTKKVIFKKNFIDCEPGMDYHHKYINLDKKNEKMENVQKDIEWRKKNNIPDFEKNWIV